MASNDIVSAILHYKRNIDKISAPPERALKHEDRLLHCINKLYKLPVNVHHLQETGVGRTVNSLRKIEGEKGLGDAAKALVSKWKTMVMMEDEAERKQKEEVSGPSEDDIKRIKIIREAELQAKREKDKSKMKVEQAETYKTDDDCNGFPMSPDSYSHEKSKNLDKENYKKRKSESVENGTSKKSKYDSNSQERNYSKYSRKTDSDESGNGDSDSEKYNPEHVTSHDMKAASKLLSNMKSSDKTSQKSSTVSTSHKNKSDSKKSSTSSSTSKYQSSSKSSSSGSKSSSSKHKSSSSSHDKKEPSKSKLDVIDDGIDNQSGASFADALGPMLMKKSPKKKPTYTSSHTPSSSVSNYSSDNLQASKEKKVKKEEKPLEPFVLPVDLEPLEPDLMSTLPVPTPYYKPNPTYSLPSHEATKRRAQAEEDALYNIMSNKNQRTKVYSGVKGGLAFVPSLYECCCRVLQQHIDALEYTGGIPYALLKPVLLVATPAQLFQFEHHNPYVIEETDELWKTHVNREFRSEQRQEYESYRDMYLRCLDEREEKYKAVTANIQKSIEKSEPVRKAKLAYIDVAKPPRNIIRKQIKNGTSKPETSRLLGKNDPDAVRVAPPKQPTTREPAVFKIKPKVAPLMQKTLKSIKMTRFKR